MKGDLFYIRVKTLEGPEYVITSNVKGFYVNKSSENGNFNPDYNERVSPCISHSLIGLMYQLSSKFSDKIEEHINAILKAEPFTLTQLIVPIKDWVAKEDGKTFNKDDFKINHDEAISGFYGLDTKGSRDWNEEFQV
jgi:hypothetical protein